MGGHVHVFGVVLPSSQRVQCPAAGKIKSHDQRVNRFSYFERYCLEKHPDHEWTKWLLALAVDGDDQPDAETLRQRQGQRIEFQPPTEGLVRAVPSLPVLLFTHPVCACCIIASCQP